MLSFIRKRLPSKDNEHQISKNDEQVNKFELEKEHNTNEGKKKKKKEKSSSTINGLVVGPTVSPSSNQINQSYSDVNYFSMMPGGLAGIVQNEKLSTSLDSLPDSYINPSEIIPTKSNINHVQPTTIKSRVIDIPITFIQKDSNKTNQKRS